jgi:hypothetical protein
MQLLLSLLQETSHDAVEAAGAASEVEVVEVEEEGEDKMIRNQGGPRSKEMPMR